MSALGAIKHDSPLSQIIINNHNIHPTIEQNPLAQIPWKEMSQISTQKRKTDTNTNFIPDLKAVTLFSSTSNHTSQKATIDQTKKSQFHNGNHNGRHNGSPQPHKNNDGTGQVLTHYNHTKNNSIYHHNYKKPDVVQLALKPWSNNSHAPCKQKQKEMANLVWTEKKRLFYSRKEKLRNNNHSTPRSHITPNQTPLQAVYFSDSKRPTSHLHPNLSTCPPNFNMPPKRSENKDSAHKQSNKPQSRLSVTLRSMASAKDASDVSAPLPVQPPPNQLSIDLTAHPVQIQSLNASTNANALITDRTSPQPTTLPPTAQGTTPYPSEEDKRSTLDQKEIDHLALASCHFSSTPHQDQVQNKQCQVLVDLVSESENEDAAHEPKHTAATDNDAVSNGEINKNEMEATHWDHRPDEPPVFNGADEQPFIGFKGPPAREESKKHSREVQVTPPSARRLLKANKKAHEPVNEVEESAEENDFTEDEVIYPTPHISQMPRN